MYILLRFIERVQLLPFIHRDMLQDPQWMLETMDSTIPYIY